MGEYVVRAPVKWGAPDGSVVVLQPGDSLPGDVSEETKLQLLAAGTVVPSETQKMVEEQDEKRRQLEEQRLKLDEAQARLQTEDIVLQQKAEQALAEVQATSPTSSQVEPRSTSVSEQREKGAQEKTKQVEQTTKQEVKSGEAGKSGPTATSQAQNQANVKK